MSPCWKGRPRDCCPSPCGTLRSRRARSDPPRREHREVLALPGERDAARASAQRAVRIEHDACRRAHRRDRHRAGGDAVRRATRASRRAAFRPAERAPQSAPRRRVPRNRRRGSAPAPPCSSGTQASVSPASKAPATAALSSASSRALLIVLRIRQIGENPCRRLGDDRSRSRRFLLRVSFPSW